MYVLIDASTGKVLHQIVLKKACYQQVNGKIITISKGNYIGTSKGMEGEAFWWMLNWLEEKGLMVHFKLFVCDQDSSVLHQLHTDLQTKGQVEVIHKPGHTKKNFVKDLRNTFGNSKCYQKFPEHIAWWFM